MRASARDDAAWCARGMCTWAVHRGVGTSTMYLGTHKGRRCWAHTCARGRCWAHADLGMEGAGCRGWTCTTGCHDRAHGSFTQGRGKGERGLQRRRAACRRGCAARGMVGGRAWPLAGSAMSSMPRCSATWPSRPLATVGFDQGQRGEKGRTQLTMVDAVVDGDMDADKDGSRLGAASLNSALGGGAPCNS